MLKPTTARTAIVAAKPTAIFPRKSKITPSMAITRIMDPPCAGRKVTPVPRGKQVPASGGSTNVFKAVADASKGLEVAGMMRVLLDLLAQPPHVHVDRSGRYPGRFPPYGVEQLVAGKNASAMIDEVFEKPEFANSGGDNTILHSAPH